MPGQRSPPPRPEVPPEWKINHLGRKKINAAQPHQRPALGNLDCLIQRVIRPIEITQQLRLTGRLKTV